MDLGVHPRIGSPSQFCRMKISPTKSGRTKGLCAVQVASGVLSGRTGGRAYVFRSLSPPCTGRCPCTAVPFVNDASELRPTFAAKAAAQIGGAPLPVLENKFRSQPMLPAHSLRPILLPCILLPPGHQPGYVQAGRAGCKF